jgi:hypothetical protein
MTTSPARLIERYRSAMTVYAQRHIVQHVSPQYCSYPTTANPASGLSGDDEDMFFTSDHLPPVPAGIDTWLHQSTDRMHRYLQSPMEVITVTTVVEQCVFLNQKGPDGVGLALDELAPAFVFIAVIQRQTNGLWYLVLSEHTVPLLNGLCDLDALIAGAVYSCDALIGVPYSILIVMQSAMQMPVLVATSKEQSQVEADCSELMHALSMSRRNTCCLDVLIVALLPVASPSDRPRLLHSTPALRTALDHLIHVQGETSPMFPQPATQSIQRMLLMLDMAFLHPGAATGPYETDGTSGLSIPMLAMAVIEMEKSHHPDLVASWCRKHGMGHVLRLAMTLSYLIDDHLLTGSEQVLAPVAVGSGDSRWLDVCAKIQRLRPSNTPTIDPSHVDLIIDMYTSTFSTACSTMLYSIAVERPCLLVPWSAAERMHKRQQFIQCYVLSVPRVDTMHACILGRLLLFMLVGLPHSVDQRFCMPVTGKPSVVLMVRGVSARLWMNQQNASGSWLLELMSYMASTVVAAEMDHCKNMAMWMACLERLIGHDATREMSANLYFLIGMWLSEEVCTYASTHLMTQHHPFHLLPQEFISSICALIPPTGLTKKQQLVRQQHVSFHITVHARIQSLFTEALSAATPTSQSVVTSGIPSTEARMMTPLSRELLAHTSTAHNVPTYSHITVWRVQLKHAVSMPVTFDSELQVAPENISVFAFAGPPLLIHSWYRDASSPIRHDMMAILRQAIPAMAAMWVSSACPVSITTPMPTATVSAAYLTLKAIPNSMLYSSPAYVVFGSEVHFLLDPSSRRPSDRALRPQTANACTVVLTHKMASSSMSAHMASLKRMYMSSSSAAAVDDDAPHTDGLGANIVLIRHVQAWQPQDLFYWLTQVAWVHNKLYKWWPWLRDMLEHKFLASEMEMEWKDIVYIAGALPQLVVHWLSQYVPAGDSASVMALLSREWLSIMAASSAKRTGAELIPSKYAIALPRPSDPLITLYAMPLGEVCRYIETRQAIHALRVRMSAPSIQPMQARVISYVSELVTYKDQWRELVRLRDVCRAPSLVSILGDRGQQLVNNSRLLNHGMLAHHRKSISAMLDQLSGLFPIVSLLYAIPVPVSADGGQLSNEALTFEEMHVYAKSAEDLTRAWVMQLFSIPPINVHRMTNNYTSELLYQFLFVLRDLMPLYSLPPTTFPDGTAVPALGTMTWAAPTLSLESADYGHTRTVWFMAMRLAFLYPQVLTVAQTTCEHDLRRESSAYSNLFCMLAYEWYTAHPITMAEPHRTREDKAWIMRAHQQFSLYTDELIPQDTDHVNANWPIISTHWRLWFGLRTCWIALLELMAQGDVTNILVVSPQVIFHVHLWQQLAWEGMYRLRTTHPTFRKSVLWCSDVVTMSQKLCAWPMLALHGDVCANVRDLGVWAMLSCK